MKKRPVKSVSELVSEISEDLRIYFADTLGMTESDIDRAMSNFDLFNNVKRNKKTYMHLTIEQIGDRVLGI